MSLRLKPAQKSLQALRALAASGSSTFAKAAQAELRARTEAELRKARAL